MKKFEIFCEWDAEAKVWFVARSNVPGLVAEAENIPQMNDRLRMLVPELLQLNSPELCEPRASLELLIQTQEKIAINC